MNTTIAELAVIVGGEVIGGDGQTSITGAAAVAEAEKGQVTFFGNSRYLAALKKTKASVALVPLDFDEEIPAVQIRVKNPSFAFAQILERFAPPEVHFEPGIHPTAVIAQDVVLGEAVCIQAYAVIESGAEIGARSVIGSHCFIGSRSKLGADCLLYPHVTVRENSVLGERVIIHSGAVIGSDGFGFEFVNGKHVKIPQRGIVQIDDDVEIGANTTIDRARFGKTWIQEGTKIDNLVQIAHNVTVGKHALLISQVGISGSSKVGNYVILAGQVGLIGHIEIGDQAVVGAKSGVSKSIPPKEKWFGIPAVPDKDFKRRLARSNQIEKLYDRVKKLEEKLGPEEK